MTHMIVFESTNSEENLNCNKSEKLSFIYKWDNNKKDSFLNIMNSEDMCNHFENLGCNIDMSNSIEDLDSNLKEFYSYIENVCNPLFKRNYKMVNNVKKINHGMT